MALILNFDTSTPVCSVALSEGGKILALRENTEGKNHAALLTVFIDEVLKEAGRKAGDLDAVAVGKGPGSYTGLRIGVSSAKGMAYALSVPVIALPTLKIMARGYATEKSLNNNVLMVPMIDARRMEVYSAIYSVSLDEIRETQAEIIEHTSFAKYLSTSNLHLFGDGAEKCKKVLSGSDIYIDSDFTISAKYMPELSLQAFENKQFEDVAYFEPWYLKDFIATTPKKKVL